MATLRAVSLRESGLPCSWLGALRCILFLCSVFLPLTLELRAALGLPGPNSRSVTTRSFVEHLFSSDGKGQGWTGAMPRLRGDKFEYILKAPPETHGTGPLGSHRINRIRKRSFKRAQQRFALHGFAYYHGRLLTGIPSNRHEQSTTSWLPPTRTGKPRKRLAICCWNAMALSSASFVELLQWASVRQIDALMIQSTHWSIEEPWTSYGYHIIPSPELHKAGGGLITAIRTCICPMHNISFQDWLPGRLLHVRCYLNQHHMDFVNIYQVPTGQTLTRPEPLKHRLDILELCSSTTSSTPSSEHPCVGR